MDPLTLRKSIVECADKYRMHKQTWDSFMYRSSILRHQIPVGDIAIILQSFAKVHKITPSFTTYMVEAARYRTHEFRIRDAAIMLSAMSKLKCFDEPFLMALYPHVAKTLNENTSPVDISLLLNAWSRLESLAQQENLPAFQAMRARRPLLFERAAAVLAPRMFEIKSPQTLTLLLNAYACGCWNGEKEAKTHLQGADVLAASKIDTLGLLSGSNEHNETEAERHLRRTFLLVQRSLKTKSRLQDSSISSLSKEERRFFLKRLKRQEKRLSLMQSPSALIAEGNPNLLPINSAKSAWEDDFLEGISPVPHRSFVELLLTQSGKYLGDMTATDAALMLESLIKLRNAIVDLYLKRKNRGLDGAVDWAGKLLPQSLMGAVFATVANDACLMRPAELLRCVELLVQSPGAILDEDFALQDQSGALLTSILGECSYRIRQFSIIEIMGLLQAVRSLHSSLSSPVSVSLFNSQKENLWLWNLLLKLDAEATLRLVVQRDAPSKFATQRYGVARVAGTFHEPMTVRELRADQLLSLSRLAATSPIPLPAHQELAVSLLHCITWRPNEEEIDDEKVRRKLARFSVLSNLTPAAASQWLTVCAKLGIRDARAVYLSRRVSGLLPAAETHVKAEFALACARLGLPNLADELSLFPLLGTAEMDGRDTRVAAATLHAASIFELTMKPSTMLPEFIGRIAAVLLPYATNGADNLLDNAEKVSDFLLKNLDDYSRASLALAVDSQLLNQTHYPKHYLDGICLASPPNMCLLQPSRLLSSLHASIHAVDCITTPPPPLAPVSPPSQSSWPTQEKLKIKNLALASPSINADASNDLLLLKECLSSSASEALTSQDPFLASVLEAISGWGVSGHVGVRSGVSTQSFLTVDLTSLANKADELLNTEGLSEFDVERRMASKEFFFMDGLKAVKSREYARADRKQEVFSVLERERFMEKIQKAKNSISEQNVLVNDGVVDEDETVEKMSTEESLIREHIVRDTEVRGRQKVSRRHSKVSSRRALNEASLRIEEEETEEKKAVDNDRRKTVSSFISNSRLEFQGDKVDYLKALQLDSFILEVIRSDDLYFSSPSVMFHGSHKNKKSILRAERFAHLQMLKRQGWMVVTISEEDWDSASSLSGENDSANSTLDVREARARLIFNALGGVYKRMLGNEEDEE